MRTEADIIEAAAIVPNIASALKTQLPAIIRHEDLVADGNFGVVKASHSFDSEAGIAWLAYAGMRARWEMMDGLRRSDPLPRGARRKGDLRLVRLEDTTIRDWFIDKRAMRVFEVIDARDTVEAIFRRLSGKHLAVIKLLYIDGLSLKQTGEIIGVDEQTVSVYRWRIMKRLRKEMIA